MLGITEVKQGLELKRLSQLHGCGSSVTCLPEALAAVGFGGTAASLLSRSSEIRTELGAMSTDASSHSIDDLYRLVVDHLPMGVVLLDADRKVIEFNAWAEKITGFSSKEVAGHFCGDVLHGGMCGDCCPIQVVIDRSKPVVRVETSITARCGKTIPIRMHTAGLFDSSGRLVGAVEIFRDISDQLTLQRERANLISMFAHDMRSSLTGIHGLGLRLMRKLDELDETKRQEYLGLITREAAKLEALVDDFLEFSRLQTGQLRLDFRSTSLDKELEELFEIYKLKADQHKLKMELKVDSFLPVIEADANRLRRVITNLLDNAIKFSKIDGRITISAQETEEEVIISIADEGIGIPAEDLPYIFDLFYRGSATSKCSGHGLGLAIVKSIVEGHGGRVVASSETSEGTTFTIYLPKKRS